MKLQLVETNPYNYTATSESGYAYKIMANPTLSGQDAEGLRPMEHLLSALAGCSAIDLRLILTKQRQNVHQIRAEVSAIRHEDKVPATFKSIHLDYFVRGEDLEESKVTKAAKLSLEKYCSVMKHLEATIKISHSISIEK